MNKGWVTKKKKKEVILTIYLPRIEMRKLTLDRNQLCGPGNFYVGSDSSKCLHGWKGRIPTGSQYLDACIGKVAVQSTLGSKMPRVEVII